MLLVVKLISLYVKVVENDVDISHQSPYPMDVITAQSCDLSPKRPTSTQLQVTLTATQYDLDL
jgi:hypothetical protein